MNLKFNKKSYNFDIDKIVEYLYPFRDRLPQLYSWKTPTEKDLKVGIDIKLFTKTEYNQLINSKNYFTRNTIMKNFICGKIKNTKNKDKLTSYYVWIIKNWGGIKGIKSEGLYERIENSLSSYNESKTLKFDKISSTTKVLNFISPNKFVIYDSRVAFALNWILLKTNSANKFFLIPEGRNSKLCAFDMSTLIRLKNINVYKTSYNKKEINKNFISTTDKNLFINKEHCYYLMNELFKEISSKLWPDLEMGQFPYYVEMLLFAIADTIIFEDILNTVHL